MERNIWKGKLFLLLNGKKRLWSRKIGSRNYLEMGDFCVTRRESSALDLVVAC